ncbi:MAG: DUF4366 domain-containing protein [Clostridiales bacterium]|nr:DUF4366 domain-containing protein [Clostridiales bacterium]
MINDKVKKKFQIALTLCILAVAAFIESAGATDSSGVNVPPPDDAVSLGDLNNYPVEASERAATPAHSPSATPAPAQAASPPAEEPSAAKGEADISQMKPFSITGEKFDGEGTLVDYVVTGNKQFFTIKTRQESIFYLVIDNDKEENNVYFLTAIKESDLPLKSENEEEPAAYAPNLRAATTAPTELPFATETPESPASGGGASTTLIMAGILFFSMIGIGWYTKIYKKKKGKKPAGDEEEDEDVITDEELSSLFDDVKDDDDE